jgi:hypothetical protein
LENLPLVRILTSSGTADFRIVIPPSGDSES